MADGDNAAVAELYDRYSAVLFSLAVRILGEQADAEEVVLEAFTQAWKRAGTFDRLRGSVGAWLTTIVRSRSLDQIRSRRRREGLGSRGTPEDTAGVSTHQEDPGRAAEHSEQQKNVRAALQTLPEPQREAIELAYYKGLSQSEIASRLGAPLGTIKTRIRDGMLKLRDALRPLYTEPGR